LHQGTAGTKDKLAPTSATGVELRSEGEDGAALGPASKGRISCMNKHTHQRLVQSKKARIATEMPALPARH